MGCKGHKMLFWSMAYLKPTKRWFSKEMVFNQIGGSFCKMVICATFHISNTKDFFKPCFEIYCAPRIIFRKLWEFLSSAPKWSIFHLPYYNYIVLTKWLFPPLFKFSSFYEYYVFFRFFFFFNRTTRCDYWFFVSTLYRILFSILLARHRKKKTTKKLQVGTREWQILFFSECVHEKTPCILCQHALQLTVWKPE